MNYIYTLHGKVVHVEPFSPFYQICHFLGPDIGFYFIRDKFPEVDESKTYYLTYSLKKGFGVVYEGFTDQEMTDYWHIKQKLIVHKHWLNFSNSVKMRYIKAGFGQEAYDRLLTDELNMSDEESVLFKQLAESKGTTVEVEKEAHKIYLSDLRFIFQYLSSIEQKMLAFVKEYNYDEAINTIHDGRLNLQG